MRMKEGRQLQIKQKEHFQAVQGKSEIFMLETNP